MAGVQLAASPLRLRISAIANRSNAWRCCGTELVEHDAEALSRRALFLLMQHPDVAAQVVKEVDSVLGDSPPGSICFLIRTLFG